MKRVLGMLLGLCGVAHAEPPLRAGVVADAPPYIVRDGLGRLSGFTVELFRLLAARMHREISFTVAPENRLYDGLRSGAYDVLPGPINATPDRAAGLLLTEGYVWSQYQFAARAGEPVRSLADLHGRRLAVRAGGLYADWADRNAVRYGFSIVHTSSGSAATQAVLAHHADASLLGSPVQEYAAMRAPHYALGLSLPETRTHESAAVRVSDTELRDEIEDALGCLKASGAVAKLSHTWFGSTPGPEDLENLVVPGYGVPGLSGYDPKPRKITC